MNYGAIKNCDIANGPGVRVSLFVSGCTHHCPGCFQPETWDFNYGKSFTSETIQEIITLLEPEYISGLTILGGEPMDYQNLDDVFRLVYTVRDLMPEKTIWIYSGSTYEELIERQEYDGFDGWETKRILETVDILVDGPFIESQKNIGLRFRGSENQRIIDLRRTEEQGKILLWKGDC